MRWLNRAEATYSWLLCVRCPNSSRLCEACCCQPSWCYDGTACLQESKAKAIQAQALQPLLAWLGNDSSSAAVRQLCCRSVAGMCQLQQGRAALAAAGGVLVLTQALQTTPDAAVAAMKVRATQLASSTGTLCYGWLLLQLQVQHKTSVTITNG